MLVAYPIRGQTNVEGDEAPAKLLPPYGQIPPSFWEQHGVLVGWIIVAVVLAIAAGVAFWLRRKPEVVLPPEVQARAALQALANRTENGAVLSEVSQILRRYFIGAFELPSGESTTCEFCRMLASNDRIGAELSVVTEDFLRKCDVLKFSPSNDVQPIGAVARAQDLIAWAEARRAEIVQTPTGPQA